MRTYVGQFFFTAPPVSSRRTTPGTWKSTKSTTKRNLSSSVHSAPTPSTKRKILFFIWRSTITLEVRLRKPYQCFKMMRWQKFLILVFNFVIKIPAIQSAGESSNPPSGSRIQYLICSECDYKAADRHSLNWHIQKKHPVATKASSSARKPVQSNNDSVTSSKSTDWALEQCDHCDFRTRWKANLRKHLEHHLYMYTIQCERCNYSVDHPSALARHVKYHHDNQEDCWEQDFSTDNEVIIFVCSFIKIWTKYSLLYRKRS